MIHMFSNNRLTKKGESLVEVLVALSIILVAFASASQIIVKSVSLNTGSRDRTKAIYKIQETKNDYIAKNIMNSCRVTALAASTNPVYESTSGCAANETSIPAGGCYYVKLVDLGTSETGDVTSKMTNSSFIKVITYGKWKTENGIDRFSISEVVAK